MNFVSALENPQLALRKAVGKIRRKTARIPEHSIIEEMKGGLLFEHRPLSFLDDDDIRAMMTHSYDISGCDCFRRHLSQGDTVLDVGANIGYMSAVAASCVGRAGEVHGFEPLTECFERLQTLSHSNPAFRLHFNNVAVGSQKGSLKIGFNRDGDMRNATLVPGKNTPETRDVPVWRLDDYIFDNIAAPERIKLIKIDVEGFEFSVLQGLERFFARGARPLIVCEVKPWEIRNIGYTMKDFDAYMKNFGYRAFDIARERRTVDLSELQDMDTVVLRAT